MKTKGPASEFKVPSDCPDVIRWGAIIGDIAGSPYEFTDTPVPYDFDMFSDDSFFTDDTVLTVAVLKGLMGVRDMDDDDEVRERVRASLVEYARAFPNCTYGVNFMRWANGGGGKPYGSCGNGSAMRVSHVGWMFGTMEQTRRVARLTSEVTHDHPEGIMAAEAVACCIFLARHGKTKDDIRKYVEENFYPNLQSYSDIAGNYRYSELARESVPESIICFLDGESFEDTVRKAVVLNGDTDTMAAIAGSIAEAFYGVPAWMKEKAVEKVLEFARSR